MYKKLSDIKLTLNDLVEHQDSIKDAEGMSRTLDALANVNDLISDTLEDAQPVTMAEEAQEKADEARDTLREDGDSRGYK